MSMITTAMRRIAILGRALRADELGATVIEYVVLLALVAGLVVASFSDMADSASKMYDRGISAMQNAG